MLGVESVPDGPAAGLLAGVSPLSGLYAYLFGTIGGSLERTRLGPLGLVGAVVITSAGVALLGWGSVALVGGLGAIPARCRCPWPRCCGWSRRCLCRRCRWRSST